MALTDMLARACQHQVKQAEVDSKEHRVSATLVGPARGSTPAPAAVVARRIRGRAALDRRGSAIDTRMEKR
jgi:hypothetical protein